MRQQTKAQAPANPRARATVPARAHPLVKRIFAEMRRQGVTYVELGERSGLARETLTAWRVRNIPDLTSLEAVLGALGLKIAVAPVDAPDFIPG